MILSFCIGRRCPFLDILNTPWPDAFKFTRPGTTVTLRVDASEDRVRIGVEDECGGRLTGNLTFAPFEQRSTDRTGLGLNLAFSQWGRGE